MLERAYTPKRTGQLLATLLVLAAVGLGSLLVVSRMPPQRNLLIASQETPPAPESVAPASAQPVDFYTTNFPAAENPLSEGGLWANGRSTGLDWQDVMTTPGKAFGTQSGNSGTYDDSTAILNGTFGPNQEATATAFNDDAGGDWNGEVELRLRSAVAPHSITGYEVEFRARPGDTAYCDIVRWNGALGDFTPLLHREGNSQCGVGNGDVVRATIVGSTITAYKNDVMIMQVTDSVFRSGNPGIGFFLHNFRGSGNAAAFGFTTFTARTLPDSN